MSGQMETEVLNSRTCEVYCGTSMSTGFEILSNVAAINLKLFTHRTSNSGTYISLTTSTAHMHTWMKLSFFLTLAAGQVLLRSNDAMLPVLK